METAAPLNIPTTNKHTSRSRRHHHHQKLLIIILNCLLLSLGNTGGPIFLRIYYLHGGRRQWLSSFLETAGFPLILIPLSLSYLRRRHYNPSTPVFHLTPPLLLASSVIGIISGFDNFLYSYGLNFIPVSTSSVLIAAQLAFTAIFAFFIVKQKFTPFSVNAVVLLTVGAAMLALHASGDRPAGVSAAGYWKGFVLTVGAAVLYGLMLPLVELAFDMAVRETVTFTVLMEVQFVMGFFATGFCAIGMVFNKDFQAIPREAAEYGLGEAKYYLVLMAAVIFFQCFFVGALGVISCANTLLAGIIIAALIPVIEVLAFIFLHEKFSSEKGVALVLSLWGLASYSYGEYTQLKQNKKEQQTTPALTVI